MLRQGFLRQNTGERVCSGEGRGQPHLVKPNPPFPSSQKVVLRDGQEYGKHVGYVPLTLSRPPRVFLFFFFFSPSCVQKKKRAFCRLLCSLTYLQRNLGAISIFHGNKTGRLWILHTVWAKRATIWCILIHAFWVSSNEKYQVSKLKECQGYFWSLQNR